MCRNDGSIAFGVQFALRAFKCLRRSICPSGVQMPSAFKEYALGRLAVKPLHRYTAIPFIAFGVQVAGFLGRLPVKPLHRYTAISLHRYTAIPFIAFGV